jgi:hypothetical protein
MTKRPAVRLLRPCCYFACSLPYLGVCRSLGAAGCDDEGVISNWEDSAFDLRRRQLTLAGLTRRIGDMVIELLGCGKSHPVR